MKHQQASRATLEDVAATIANWMTPEKSIHWVVPSNPEQQRIRFRVRPQFADILKLALACKATYGNQF